MHKDFGSKLMFKGPPCFNGEWVGFDSLSPINLIIGRNNTGKSRVIEAISSCCLLRSDKSKSGRSSTLKFKYSIRLNSDLLKTGFNERASGGLLVGEHWKNHGAHFKDITVEYETNGDEKGAVSFPPGFDITSPFGHQSTVERKNIIESVLHRGKRPLEDRKFSHLPAERDIQPSSGMSLINDMYNASTATALIAHYINDSSRPRELIQSTLLSRLNEIMGPDGTFSELIVRYHQSPTTAQIGATQLSNCWEIFLREAGKGIVPLSKSGSGIKTIIMVLLHLLVIPETDRISPDLYAYAFEELENNLHPSLLRRLLAHIEKHALSTGCIVFLTTHSSAALDMFATSKNASILHVMHDGKNSSSTTIHAHFEKLHTIRDLGARPSDLLQANGIIWVEGPSDRIYINRFIELFSDANLHEGIDYQVAYYGGSLLERYGFYDPGEIKESRANLLLINSRAIIIADGDRTGEVGEESELKARVSRIVEEINGLPLGYAWITAAKEIENYIPCKALEKVYGLKGLPEIGKNDWFFKRGSKNCGPSGYFVTHCEKTSFDKVLLAESVSPLLTKEDLSGRFDLEEHVLRIIQKIREWNDLQIS